MHTTTTDSNKVRSPAGAALGPVDERYRTLFNSIDEGFCVVEVLFDEAQRPLDYRFLEINAAFERQTGIENAVGRRMREIAPLHEAHWFEIYGRVALTGEPVRFENPAAQLQRHYEVYAFRVGEPADRQVGILFKDITERKQAEARQAAAETESARLYEQAERRRRQLELLSRRLVQVQEQERRTLSRDLHDTSGQHLTALLLGLNALKRDEGLSERTRARIDGLVDTAVAASEELHRLALDLRPASLDRYGLMPALEQLLAEFRKQTGVNLRFAASGIDASLERLPSDMETALYRIVQESLTNVSRYAEARTVEVWLEQTAAAVELMVADDGRGFDVEEALRRGRLGLLGMRERAEMLGGTLAIESSPGRGTRVTATMPAWAGEPAGEAAGLPVLASSERATAGMTDAAEPDLVLAEAAELARAKALSDALVDITAGMARQRDANNLLAYVFARSAETVGCDYASMVLRESDHWFIAHGYHLAESVIGLRVSDDEVPLAVAVERTGEPVVLQLDALAGASPEHVAHPSADSPSPLFSEGISSARVNIPLVAGSQFLGVAAYVHGSASMPFKPSEVNFLQRLAALVSLALQNMRLCEDAYRQRDELARRIEELQVVQAQREAALASLEEAISSLRASDEQLRNTEAQARDLIRHAPTGIYTVDFRTGGFSAVNDAMCEILGYTREELLRMSAFDLLDEPCKSVFAERIRRTLAGEKVDASVEYCVRPSHGGIIYAVLSTRILYENGQPTGAFVIAHDVSERRRAADQLRKQSQELRQQSEHLSRLSAEQQAILDAIADALIVYDREGRIVRMNAVAEAMLGYSAQARSATILDRGPEMVRPHKADGSAFRPDEYPAVRALRGEVVRDEEMFLSVPARPGGLRVAVTSAPVRDPNGTVTGCVTTFRDTEAYHAVTEQLSHTAARLQEANDALEAQAAELREASASLERRVQERTAELEAQAMLIENARDAIIATDAALRATFFNKAAEEMYGWRAEEVVSHDLAAVTRAQMAPDVRGAMFQTLEDAGRWRGEAVHLRRDDTPFWVEAQIVTLRDRAGEISGYITVNRDVTARKQAEEELRVSREQLRELSHRVVELQETERHTLANQLYNDQGQRLAAALLNLRMLQRDGRCEPPVVDRLDQATSVIDGVLLDMHNLAVDLWPVSLERLGLGPALRRYATEFQRRSGAEVYCDLVALEPVHLPPKTKTNVFRIVQEACDNATRHGKATSISISAVHDAGRITIVVKDDGTSSDARAPRGGGALRLLSMQERAQSIGGSVRMESMPGKGTALTIEAPDR